MNVYFGNLSVEALVERCKLKSITKEEIEILEKYRCNSAKVEKDKFHIFDIPHTIHCNGEATNVVIEVLSKYANEFDVPYNVEEIESKGV